MAEHKRTTSTPPDPNPVSPRNEAVIDGNAVTFEWEAVDGAVEYRLQVSAEGTFDTIFHEETTTSDTHSLARDFPPNDDTFFWRVMARTEGGWSAGEKVESFISGTAEQAALHLERPDDDEHYGPYPELIRSAGKEVAAETTGKAKFYEDEARDGVEHEGVETGQILGIMVAVILAIILLIITAFLLVGNLEQTVRREVVGTSGYPERQQAQAEAQEKLGGYGIIDEETGVYQIPIERAMELTAEEYAQSGEGLSSEVTIPSQAPVAGMMSPTGGGSPAGAAGTMPADSTAPR